jgi:hypothetical protein
LRIAYRDDKGLVLAGTRISGSKNRAWANLAATGSILSMFWVLLTRSFVLPLVYRLDLALNLWAVVQRHLSSSGYLATRRSTSATVLGVKRLADPRPLTGSLRNRIQRLEFAQP